MKKYFISSHGHLASGVLSSLEILFGNTDGVTVFDAYLDERTVEGEVEKFLSETNDSDQVILLSDVYGGSVNSILYRYLQRDNTILITGFNLSLLLELMVSLMDEEDLSIEKIDVMIAESRQMMKRISLNESHEQKEEFF